jgi:hypothetical protein
MKVVVLKDFTHKRSAGEVKGRSHAGDVLELSEARAKTLIEKGLVEPVKSKKEKEA